jgi:lipopolysaccharide transport system ATP-binding protein
MSTVVKIENVSKQYRLGSIGTNTLKGDLQSWWYNVRGLPNPTLMIGQENSLKNGNSGSKEQEQYVWALKDINLEVKQGEVLGVIGKNGAGKSTLLKLLSRVTAPTTGSIKVKGRIASLLEVGTGFHPDLTGRENIYLNGAILGMTKTEIRSKLEEIIDFAGIAKYIDTPVKRYSSGMYVRLAFAVAAHLEPEILIIDEVLAVGDAEFQKKAIGKMQDVSRTDGRTVMFVSHNMAAVSNLCNESILLQNGLLQAKGLTKYIIEQYISTGNSSKGEISGDNIIYRQKSTRAYFNSIRLRSKTGVSDSFGIGEEVQVELEYSVTIDGSKINPSIHLLDKFGTCILASANLDSATVKKDPFYGKSLQKGRYKSVCIIPAYFLNDVNYRISAFLVTENTNEIASADEVLSFNIIETGEMRKEYSGEWIGQIRPKMLWETEFQAKI